MWKRIRSLEHVQAILNSARIRTRIIGDLAYWEGDYDQVYKEAVYLMMELTALKSELEQRWGELYEETQPPYDGSMVK